MYYKEYKIQYILIENTTIIFEAITLFDKKTKTEEITTRKYPNRARQACMDGFSNCTVY